MGVSATIREHGKGSATCVWYSQCSGAGRFQGCKAGGGGQCSCTVMIYSPGVHMEEQQYRVDVLAEFETTVSKVPGPAVCLHADREDRGCQSIDALGSGADKAVF